MTSDKEYELFRFCSRESVAAYYGVELEKEEKQEKCQNKIL